MSSLDSVQQLWSVLLLLEVGLLYMLVGAEVGRTLDSDVLSSCHNN